VILQQRRCHEPQMAPAWHSGSFHLGALRLGVLSCNAAVTVRWSDGRQIHFLCRLDSGGGCICPELRQRSCPLEHLPDGAVRDYQFGDLIHMPMWIRRIYPNAGENEAKTMERIV
jgi:hypothetical protein